MKFSFRQILASASGAVLAAVIASLFGVKGTIVGVAIGSAAATFGTALVAQSIEHGREAVKQVVVRVPDTSTLLRRMGSTHAAGVTESTPAEPAGVTEDTTTTTALSDQTADLQQAAAPAIDITTKMALAGAGSDPVTEPLDVMPPVAEPTGPTRGFRWPAIAGTVAIVFVLSLIFVTSIELIAGKPLANLFGGHVTNTDPSVVRLFTPSPAPPTTTTTTTSTTTTSTTSTTTTVPNDTTTTTAVGGTTTTGGSGTTTTTTVGVTTTTT
jgi:hypothetical protein